METELLESFSELSLCLYPNDPGFFYSITHYRLPLILFSLSITRNSLDFISTFQEYATWKRRSSILTMGN